MTRGRNKPEFSAEGRSLPCLARQVWHEAPWIFLWVQHFPIVHSAKATDIGSLPNEKFDALYASRRSSTGSGLTVVLSRGERE